MESVSGWAPTSDFDNLDHTKCTKVPRAGLLERLLMTSFKVNTVFIWLLFTTVHYLRRDEVVQIEILNIVRTGDSSLKYMLILKNDLKSN